MAYAMGFILVPLRRRNSEGGPPFPGISSSLTVVPFPNLVQDTFE